MKSETIKVGKIPVGQRKTFVIGPLDVGDAVTVKYDEKNPARAIIAGNIRLTWKYLVRWWKISVEEML